MSQKSSVPQAVSFVSQVLKRDSLMSVGVFSVDDDQIYAPTKQLRALLSATLRGYGVSSIPSNSKIKVVKVLSIRSG